MRDPALAARVHRNLMEVSSWSGQAPGGAIDRHDGELLFSAATSMPFLNGAMREGPGGDAGAFLARAREFFFGRGHGFVTFAWPGDPELAEAALADGMLPVLDRYPEMVCRAPLPELPGDLRPVEDPAGAQAYWELCDTAYPSLGFPERMFTEAFTAESLLDADRMAACLAFADDRPVACASVYLAEGVGMVGWVAALPEARRRGHAAACTVWATNEAFARGADVASLQASPMGEDLYRRLGYEELYAYRVLGAMPPG